jgi:hypothetical protein
MPERRHEEGGMRTATMVLSVATLCLMMLAACGGGSESPTPTPTEKTVEATPTQGSTLQQYRGVRVGMCSDDVLKVWGKGSAVRELGSDSRGLIVEWHYPDATLLFKSRTESGITCYRVMEIRLR